MEKTTAIIPFRQSESVYDPLTAIARDGAHNMLAAALKAEAETFVAEYFEELLKDGRQRVVRNGYGPERSIQTGMYPSGLTGVDFSVWLPIPRCQIFDAVDFMIGDMGQDPSQPSFWIDVVHAGGFDQGVGDSCGFAAAF